MEKKELEEMDKLQVGDIFFTPLDNLSSQEILDIECDDEDALICPFVCSVQENANIDPNCLIAVKYIGNGMFEEMVTGEKMFCFSEGLSNVERVLIECENNKITGVSIDIRTRNFTHCVII